MSKVLQRMKSVFRRGPSVNNTVRPGQLPPGSSIARPNNPDDFSSSTIIRKPPVILDDSDEDNTLSGGSYNIRSQTIQMEKDRFNNRPTTTTTSSNPYTTGPTLPPVSSNLQPRNNSGGFVSDRAFDNNPTSPPNSSPMSSMASRPQHPTPPPPPLGQPNSTQFSNPSSQPPPPPPPNFSPQPMNNSPSTLGGFPPGLNLHQGAPSAPSNTNFQSSPGGYPPSTFSNPQQQPPPPSINLPIPLPPPNTNPPNSSSFSNNSPTMSGGFPSSMSPQPPGPTSVGNNPPTPFAMFSSSMNPHSSATTSVANNPPPLTGRPAPPMNVDPRSTISSGLSTNPVMPSHSQQSNTTSFFPQNQLNDNSDNVSRVEIDYPIENILIDANIPSSVAYKINDTVEHDRFGNPYRVHRFTFDPPTQKVSFGDDQQTTRHQKGDSPMHGTRHIREISLDREEKFDNQPKQHRRRDRRYHSRNRNYHSVTRLGDYVEHLFEPDRTTIVRTDDFNDLNRILGYDQYSRYIAPLSSATIPAHSSLNNLNEPIFYYTARALPNDPMRIH